METHLGGCASFTMRLTSFDEMLPAGTEAEGVVVMVSPDLHTENREMAFPNVTHCAVSTPFELTFESLYPFSCRADGNERVLQFFFKTINSWDDSKFLEEEYPGRNFELFPQFSLTFSKT